MQTLIVGVHKTEKYETVNRGLVAPSIKRWNQHFSRWFKRKKLKLQKLKKL